MCTSRGGQEARADALSWNSKIIDVTYTSSVKCPKILGRAFATLIKYMHYTLSFSLKCQKCATFFSFAVGASLSCKFHSDATRSCCFRRLSDIQFFVFMQHVTDLNSYNIYRVFDMLDVDGSGEIDFDEFYLLMCILIAVKVNGAFY